MNIKIEINTRIWKANIYKIVNFFGHQIQTQDQATIFANKLVALTDRSVLAHRDIYDVYFFFRHMFPLNEALILERTGKTKNEYLLFLIDFLQKYGNHNLLDGLGEVLDPKQKVFVKERLLQELL